MKTVLRLAALAGLIGGILLWRRVTTPARLVVLPPWTDAEKEAFAATWQRRHDGLEDASH